VRHGGGEEGHLDLCIELKTSCDEGDCKVWIVHGPSGDQIDVIADPNPFHSFGNRRIIDSVGGVLGTLLDSLAVQSRAG
jgi:hypothetical protein